MTTGNDLQMKVSELACIRKQLDQNGMDELKKSIEKYVAWRGSNDLEDVLPFIINFVYDEAYTAACNDVLKIMRE